jgi:hypothetical protein
MARTKQTAEYSAAELYARESAKGTTPSAKRKKLADPPVASFPLVDATLTPIKTPSEWASSGGHDADPVASLVRMLRDAVFSRIDNNGLLDYVTVGHATLQASFEEIERHAAYVQLMANLGSVRWTLVHVGTQQKQRIHVFNIVINQRGVT